MRVEQMRNELDAVWNTLGEYDAHRAVVEVIWGLRNANREYGWGYNWERGTIRR